MSPHTPPVSALSHLAGVSLCLKWPYLGLFFGGLPSGSWSCLASTCRKPKIPGRFCPLWCGGPYVTGGWERVKAQLLSLLGSPEYDYPPELSAAMGWSCHGEFCLNHTLACSLPVPGRFAPLPFCSPWECSLYTSLAQNPHLSNKSTCFPIPQMRGLECREFQPLPQVSHSQGWLSWALGQLWCDSKA